jgi:hypothetical protein
MFPVIAPRFLDRGSFRVVACAASPTSGAQSSEKQRNSAAGSTATRGTHFNYRDG